MILDFYKDIFIHSTPELLDNLQEEYNGSINDYKYDVDDDDCLNEEQKKQLLEVDIADLLHKMKKTDI